MTSHRYDPITRLVDARQAACGTTKVIAVDGPSGSGKTSLSEGLAGVTGGTVVHLDDVYPGWDGLAATPPMIADALDDIAVGRIARLPRWSWVRNRPVRSSPVPLASLLILDGVGSGSAVIRPHLSVLLWVDAPVDVRRRRGLARDGGAYEPHWDRWAAQEAELFATEQTRRYADLVIAT